MATSAFISGDLLVSKSIYAGTASTVTLGAPLPTTGVVATNDGTYPNIFLNNKVDANFGITAPIYLDQLTTSGTLIDSINVTDTLKKLSTPIDLSTSFPSKSELALNLSSDGKAVTFVGYSAPVNQLDISNSNTLGVIDPTNTDTATPTSRTIVQVNADGTIAVTPTNAYSGNNGRAVALASNGLYYTAGNAGNSGTAVTGDTLTALSNNTGVQAIAPGDTSGNTTVVGAVKGTAGSLTGYQRGFSVTDLGFPADKTGKDDNFRGLTINPFDNSIYVTKGSGGNGVNTVYKVTPASGTLPSLANAGTATITPLPGFPTVLASSAAATHPFGIWFADANTLYVADEGSGANGVGGTPDANAGLEKWSFDKTAAKWTLDYTLQNGLDLGKAYTVANGPNGEVYPTALDPATGGLRNITGKVNSDGTVTVYAVTSTVSTSGDQGADPNKLVAITDKLAATKATDVASESFTTLEAARYREVLRGISFTPTDSSLPASTIPVPVPAPNPPASPAQPKRNFVIFVADGLRNEAVNAADTPTLYNLRQQGVNFTNSHSVFPTFTTPNAAAIATGHYPGDTGDFSNTIYTGVPIAKAGGSATPFIENDPILGDIDAKFASNNFLNEESILQAAKLAGYNTAAVGKLGPTAIQDVSTVNPISGTVPIPGTVIIDDSTGSTSGVPLSADITAALTKASLATTTPNRTNGAAATSQQSNGFNGVTTTNGVVSVGPGTLAPNTVQQQYFIDATTKAILPAFENGTNATNPFGLVYWSRDPDGTQHNQGDSFQSLTPGINGPTTKAALKNTDNNLKQLLDYLNTTKDANGNTLASNTDVFITADHGFSTISKSFIDAQGDTTKSYAATLDFSNGAVSSTPVPKGQLPKGFVAIDIAHFLNQTLYDPDQVDQALSADGKNVTYKAVDPTKGQLPNNGNAFIGGNGFVNGVANAKVVVAANGGSDLLYLPDNNRATALKLVDFLAKQDYISGIFIDDKALGGPIPGALSVADINLQGMANTPTPSIVINFKTFSTDPANPNLTEVEIADTALAQGQGMHGSFGRGDTFNNMAAIGPDFKVGYTDTAPVSNADVALTLAKAIGLTLPSNGTLTGRADAEALVGGPNSVSSASGVLQSATAANGVATTLDYQTVDGTKYFDAAGSPGNTVGLTTSAPTTTSPTNPAVVPAKPGTTVEFAENVDATWASGGTLTGLDAKGNAFDLSQLPVDSKGNPVYPNQYLKTNTIFDIASQAGLQTAWSDKHPAAYTILAGPSSDPTKFDLTTGKVGSISDYYSLEINAPVAIDPTKQGPLPISSFGALVDKSTNTPFSNTNPNITASFFNDATKGNPALFKAPPAGFSAQQFSSYATTSTYDDYKVKAILNEIDGLNATGTSTVPGGAPAIFGLNLQAVSVAEKEPGTLFNGGGIDANGNARPDLISAVNHVDQSIGLIMNELKAKGLDKSTLVVLTAKHGQNPVQDPTVGLNSTFDSVTGQAGGDGNLTAIGALLVRNGIQLDSERGGDTSSLIYLKDRADTAKAVALLNSVDPNKYSFDNTANTISDPTGQTLFSAQDYAAQGTVLAGQALINAGLGDPTKNDRTPDLAVALNNGYFFGNATKKRSEHGGFTDADTHVATIVASAGLAATAKGTTSTQTVSTTEIAPTTLEALGLNPNLLDGVKLDGTVALPGLATSGIADLVNTVGTTPTTPATTATAPFQHVLIVSVDGLHNSDLNVANLQSSLTNIKSLQSQGITYSNAFSAAPSDSFPGELNYITGANPGTTGVFYDKSYSRTLYAPGTTLAEIQAGMATPTTPGTGTAPALAFDQNNLLDLRNVQGAVALQAQTTSDAAFNNYVGFYRVDDATGKIGNLKPGDAGYAQAALAQSLSSISKNDTKNTTLAGGGLYAAYEIANGSVSDFLAKNPNNQAASPYDPHAYFGFTGANPDGISHLMAMGTGKLGWEDTFGGGNRDYHDVVLQIRQA